MGLDVRFSEKEPGVYLVILKGEINSETHEILTQQLSGVICKAKAAVLDMGQVSYISSMGLSALFRLKLGIEERAGTIALVNMQPQVKLVFEATKILSPQMFASLQDADDYLDKFLDGVQKGTIKPRIPSE
jgi:anti-anti-sigma factor